MSQNNNHERLTRKLAYMLRHQPEEFDVEVDKFGYADLEDVLDALSEELDEDIEVEDVTEAIEAGDRPRYEIVDGRIRALYGHSIAVDPGEPTEPPEELYLGMGSRDADRASKSGLNAGRRRFLHLTTSEDDAKEMGRRAAPEYAVVTVFAHDAWEDGVSFYDRKSLFLSDAIATDHLEVGEVFTDGERSERGGRRGRGRGGRGRGGRNRGDQGGERRGGGGEDRSRRDDSGGDRGRGDSRRDDRPARREEAPREAAPAAEASGGFGSEASEPIMESAPEPIMESAPEPSMEPAPEPVMEPAPEPVMESAPEPVMEPVPEPVMEPAPEPTPMAEAPAEADSGSSFGSGL